MFFELSVCSMWGREPWKPFPLRLECWVAWSYADLMQITKVAMSSWAQRSCNAQKAMDASDCSFCSSESYILSSCTSLFPEPWQEDKPCRHLWLSTPLTLSALWSVWSFFVNRYPLPKKLFRWGLTAALNTYGYRDMNLESSLTCPFSRADLQDSSCTVALKYNLEAVCELQ